MLQKSPSPAGAEVATCLIKPDSGRSSLNILLSSTNYSNRSRQPWVFALNFFFKFFFASTRRHYPYRLPGGEAGRSSKKGIRGGRLPTELLFIPIK